MKRFSTIGLTSCAALVLLAGCGGGSHSSTGASGAMPSIPIAASQLSAPAVGANLYVGNSEGAGGIAVYAPGSDKPLRTIPVTAVSALAIRSSNLYVACRFADVRVYKNGKTLLRTIKKGISDPLALAFGSSGNLFVANRNHSSVTVYAPSNGMLVRKVVQGVDTPQRLSFDASGNLYVGNSPPSGRKSVTVYAPSKGKPLRTIDEHLDLLSLALDASGNLYVGTSGEVQVYANLGTKLLRTISGGAYALALDAPGNLYVATSYSVKVYAKDSAKLLRTISAGVSRPRALVFDGAGNLYVANHGLSSDGSTITVYAPNSDKVSRTISKGVHYPDSLTFGP